MFTFFIQVYDLVALGIVQFFMVFFVISWALFFYRLRLAKQYQEIGREEKARSVSVIIPVVDEPLDIWDQVLMSVSVAIRDMDAEVFVVANGSYSEENAKMAEGYGFNVIRLTESSKRNAITVAAKEATKEIAVILDSDTFVYHWTIELLCMGFTSDDIGGITPRQKAMFKTTIIEKVCDWFEDVRFNNSLKGLSAHGQVHCLPGRLFAIRANLLKKYIEEFNNQTLFGIKVETGDDRVLTSMLLKDGYKTLYDENTVVSTMVPKTLKGFIKQRTRWSRSSFRETMLSLGWIHRYPYAMIGLLGDILMRWMFFAVLATFLYKVLTGNLGEHAINLTIGEVVIGCIIGFFISGYLKQIPHLNRRPEDFFLTPVFSVITTFVLTPVEWYGNLTFWKQGWLTRKTTVVQKEELMDYSKARILYIVAILIGIFITLCFVLTNTASAEGRPFEVAKSLKYDCSVTKKPGKIRDVQVRPSDINNGRIIIRFDDSKRAHVVRVKLCTKKKCKSFLTNDDGWHTFNGLKNGKTYKIKLRGESNCGNGKWSEEVKSKP